MAVVIPNGFALVSWRFGLLGDPEEMSTTVGVDFGTMAGSDQQNVDSLADHFMVQYPVGSIFAGWSFRGCTARVGISGGDTVTVEANRIHVGTAVGETLPQNCAVLVKKTTALGGRRGRGRMYIPPFALGEGTVDKAGFLSSASLANVQLGVNLVWGSNFALYLLHDDVPSAMDPTPITAFTVQPQIATQRRRLRR